MRAGVMKRQARGGGPVASGAFSVKTVKTAKESADGAAGQRGGPQLRRRLRRADLRAVPEVRRALRELLSRWGSTGGAETAELLTSELVTNALVHTDSDAVLTATVGPRGLRVEVRDFLGRKPTLRPANADDGTPRDDTHGRGLVLVESLADKWGVRRHDVGKSVWFELNGGAA